MSERCPDCGQRLDVDESFATRDKRTRHAQAPVSFGSRHAHVDEALAPLIRACWSLGIWTTASCQALPDDGLGLGRAYVAFEPGSAERFVATATVEVDLADEESAASRMGAFSFGPDDAAAWTWIPAGLPWDVHFVAYFPPGDIPELIRLTDG